MPVALPLTDRISQSALLNETYRVKKAQFGNGYSQRAKDGINNKVQVWQLVFSALDATETATLRDALDSTEGTDYITWTPYLSTGSPAEEKRFVLDGQIEYGVLSGDRQDVRVVLQEVFDV